MVIVGSAVAIYIRSCDRNGVGADSDVRYSIEIASSIDGGRVTIDGYRCRFVDRTAKMHVPAECLIHYLIQIIRGRTHNCGANLGIDSVAS